MYRTQGRSVDATAKQLQQMWLHQIDLPPQLVVFAEDEWLREANEKWIKALNEAGAPVESYMQPDKDHLWPTWHWQKAAKQTYDRMIEFMDLKL